LLFLGCASVPRGAGADAVGEVPAVVRPADAEAPAPAVDAPVDAADVEDGDTDDGPESADSGDDPEDESRTAVASEGPSGPRYTADVDDATLEKLWKENPAALGSLSIGFADAGRIVNAVPFPDGPHWTVYDRAAAWATQETIDYVAAAVTRAAETFPGTPPLRLSHLSRRDGGWMRPHHSHQSGRDADLPFHYPAGRDRCRPAERCMDLPRNWALLRALVTETDLQFVLVDRRIQKVLRDHALSVGEDRAWVDSLFLGEHRLVMHARRHRDHFHARFFNPRAQELGRRVQPLMPKGRPEYNVAVHRVRRGDTLGALAMRYGTSVAFIRKVNRMRGSFLRAGQTLLMPLQGPCQSCPQAPEVVVPPRRLPPSTPPAMLVKKDAPPPAPVAAAPQPAPDAEPAKAAPLPAASDAAAPAAPASSEAAPAALVGAEAPVPASAPAAANPAPRPAIAGSPAAPLPTVAPPAPQMPKRPVDAVTAPTLR